MQLWFNNKPVCPINSAEVTSDNVLIAAESGRPLRYDFSIHAKLYLQAATNLTTAQGQANLTLQENALRTQLAGAYGDLVLKQDSGAYSGLALVNNNSISGVTIIKGPDFIEAMNAEYIVYRTAVFTGKATFLIPNTANAVVSYRETLQYVGNGDPEFSWRKSINTPSVLQQVYPTSTYKLQQTGQCVGHLAYPLPPTPFFPKPIFQGAKSNVGRTAPKRIGPALNALIEYGISWSYYYESNAPMVVLPNVPGF